MRGKKQNYIGSVETLFTLSLCQGVQLTMLPVLCISMSRKERERGERESEID